MYVYNACELYDIKHINYVPKTSIQLDVIEKFSCSIIYTILSRTQKQIHAFYIHTCS